MTLIDHTYFRGLLTIGDISKGNSPVVGNTVNDTFIPIYEKEYLRKALGDELYLDFIAGLAEDPIAQKWLDLRDGIVYTVNDKRYVWQGFVNSDKVSPIANYVYIEYMTNNAVQSTGTGTGVNNQQNATPVSPSAKIQRASSDMLTMNDSLYYYLRNHTDDYGELDWYGCRRRFGFRNMFGI
jgi:hypothetical protein